MFVIYDKNRQLVPIKVWLEKPEDLEPNCLEQAINLSNLPFAYKHIAIMPDTHSGYGMPIGGVLATKDVIIPNAVGVDIGCGMSFVHTNVPASLLYEVKTPSNGSLGEYIVGSIMRIVPTGFDHHTVSQPCNALDAFDLTDDDPFELKNEIPNGCYQVGTLGGGNHFIELQEDSNGYLGIMLHSGSRNFGYKICKYFNDRAKELNKEWFSSVPPEYDLAFLPVRDRTGLLYIRWMNLALAFAKENRQLMMKRIKEVVFGSLSKYAKIDNVKVDLEIDVHHNYAALEHHFDQNVWVHRKGAVLAREGNIVIIPGAMGSYSYIARGLGNAQSFMSCSHGAGRKLGRKEAERQFSVQDVLKDLSSSNIVLGKADKSDIAEECRQAYKDIDTVIANEADLVVPFMRLKTLAVIKG